MQGGTTQANKANILVSATQIDISGRIIFEYTVDFIPQPLWNFMWNLSQFG